MKCVLTKASDYKFRKEVEVNTLEDLCAYANQEENGIIFSRFRTYEDWDEEKHEWITCPLRGEYLIMIYDDYVE